MKRKHINRLEEHLEQFIEGAFASLFGKKIRAHDIALQLARAMEDSCIAPQGSDPRRVVSDAGLSARWLDADRILITQAQPGRITAISVCRGNPKLRLGSASASTHIRIAATITCTTGGNFSSNASIGLTFTTGRDFSLFYSVFTLDLSSHASYWVVRNVLARSSALLRMFI